MGSPLLFFQLFLQLDGEAQMRRLFTRPQKVENGFVGASLLQEFKEVRFYCTEVLRYSKSCLVASAYKQPQVIC